MAIPTSRTKEKAKITIDKSKCVGCGLCVEVCKDFSLELKNGKCSISKKPIFGCVGCGHCMAICPKGAIKINGRCISQQDLFNLPKTKETASYKSLLALLQRRRSVREFKDIPVEKELIEKVIEAAQTAPMGIPPSDVNVLILDTKEKVHNFAKDFCELLKSLKWLTSKWFLALMRPFWGKLTDEFFKGFVKPAFNVYINNMDEGKNLVNYDAPAALYFYGSPYGDPADPIVAATYAMIAAESLGLGTCMIGAVHPFTQIGKAGRKFRKKHGIKFKSKEGLLVIMGYPRIRYQKAIRRTFASVKTID